MPKSEIFAGLEIGTSKTCIVVGEVKPNQSVKILGVGNSPSAGVRKGEITDFRKASACLRDALSQAEEAADVTINSVFLSITGSHIKSFNQNGTLRLEESDPVIQQHHIEEVREMASAANVPQEYSLIHPISRFFTVDGKDEVTNPLNLPARTLDTESHLIYGVQTRIDTSIKLVRENSLEVEDVVFAPLASALKLSSDQKKAGALVIDIGGGTTDFVLYINGFITASGTIPAGGDHITNDIHLVAKIPHSKAESLKIDEGDAFANEATSLGQIQVSDEHGMLDITIERLQLNQIIRFRLEEILYLVKQSLNQYNLNQLGYGVVITGGSSKMRGLGDLANEIFDGVNIYNEISPDGLSGNQHIFREPEFSTAIGLIRYAQFIQTERPTRRQSKFKSFLRSLINHPG